MNAPKPFVGLVDFKLYVDDSLMELRVQGPPLRFPVDADALGEALAEGLRGILHCKPKAEAPAQAFQSTPFTIEEVQDAARFRWLCSDQVVASERAHRDNICRNIMQYGSLSGARLAIDEALKIWRNNPKPAMEPGK